MTKDHWLQSALTNDVLVAELLLRLKHSSGSDLDSLRAPPPTETATALTTILPRSWGNRKSRSKSTAPTISVAAGYKKEQRGSPTTHLSWSGGSSSDVYEDSCRPSDLSSGSRSVKANEGASISSCHKFEKQKTGSRSNKENEFEQQMDLKLRIFDRLWTLELWADGLRLEQQQGETNFYFDKGDFDTGQTSILTMATSI
ncbi:hypothetical protein E3N88_16131 [Mikania micrantha]|uniref:Uncharacterized protein n=1 Tax=Mikania micrantha TaxID=192012 RepID=A0A5N6NZA1_9ASTR|nr:hypothetical protein E3N88_16131 [Mikania micrantha]